LSERHPFDEVRQRRALRALVDTPRFLESDEGLEFIEELRESFAPSLLASGRRLGIGSRWCEADDVVHTAIVGLLSDDGRVAKYAASASSEPWSYVARCLHQWMRSQWGTRGVVLDDEMSLCGDGDVTPEQLTPIDMVVQITYGVLAPHTRSVQHADLLSVLRWCAANPPQRRSYEGQDRTAAWRTFPSFNQAQIAAILRVCWGVRPRAWESSLMGAVLRNSHFRPSDSPSHARAILRYRRIMLASQTHRVSGQHAA
jgi:hypothetical protein